jgi:hypothetical protein
MAKAGRSKLQPDNGNAEQEFISPLFMRGKPGAAFVIRKGLENGSLDGCCKTFAFAEGIVGMAA